MSDGNSVLLEAVCGAGKTELVYQTIAEMLKRGKKVGFAIPRRQVVIELADRMRNVFTKLKVVAVCQGYTDCVLGDLIICTTHQLYRYSGYFDLLIIDEPDAFPYKGNDVLQGIAEKSCRGVKVYLSATPDENLRHLALTGKLKYLYLPKRPTNKDMIVPRVLYLGRITMILTAIYHIWKCVSEGKQVLLFVPTITQGRRLYRLMRLIFKSGYIDSKIENKDHIIQDFKQKRFDLLMSTTILERGITIKSINLIVYQANNPVFDEASLVQMAGRVGRSIEDPNGLCLFLSEAKCESIDQCVNRIVRANND